MGEVFMTRRLVIGSAVKRVPSRVQEVGGAVCTRILAHVLEHSQTQRIR